MHRVQDVSIVQQFLSLLERNLISELNVRINIPDL
jgi:hypothetical protein